MLYFGHKEIQELLTQMSQKNFLIELSQEMKNEGYVIPEQQHLHRTQQSHRQIEEHNAVNEETPRYRRRIAENDSTDVSLDNNGDEAQPTEKKTKRRLEF